MAAPIVQKEKQPVKEQTLYEQAMNPQKKESGFGNWRKGDFGDSKKGKAGMQQQQQQDEYPEPYNPNKAQQQQPYGNQVQMVEGQKKGRKRGGRKGKVLPQENFTEQSQEFQPTNNEQQQ